MKEHDSAIAPGRPSLPTGVRWGLIGVLGFSLSVPLTRVAVADGGLSALFVGAGRAVIAGVLAVIMLVATRQRRPSARQWARLAVVAAGIVIGFPLLTSFALTHTQAGHGAVVIAVLPAATAMAVVLRTKERTAPVFWMSAVIGAVGAVAFAGLQGGGIGGIGWADLLLFAAVASAAVGYTEGGLLARELGAWQTICWALVIGLPVTTALFAYSASTHPPHANVAQWLSFLYLALVSMFLGFFAWYRGLAIGPMATVSQIQLVQPVLSIGWAALLLGEKITLATGLGALVVVSCAAVAVRARTVPTTPTPRPRQPSPV